jgi:hypothetical protein
MADNKKRVEVPFDTVRVPMIVYKGEETDNLPQVVKAKDLQLFMKECRLAGYEAEKKTRNVVLIGGDDWLLGYKRKRKLWIKDQPIRKFPPLFPNASFDPKLFIHHADKEYRRWQIQMYKGMGISMSGRMKKGERCISLAKSPEKT